MSKQPSLIRRLSAACAFVLCMPALALAQAAALPTETPASFETPTASFNYERRIAMIPMRDGVKLKTVILLPRGARNAAMILTRTPYGAAILTQNAESSDLASTLYGYDNATDVIVDEGYIRVIQDVRGKYGSEGDYVMNRPMRGPLNPSEVDHSTDTWDTIEWLVKNVPQSNGRVGIIGISYNGFTALTALVNPHPALKVSVPMNPMVDGWRGDDWFHNGAFRQVNLAYILEQVATRANDAKWFTSHLDDYDTFMRAGSAGELARQRGVTQTGFFQKVAAHPSYDAFWQEQAMDAVLARQPLTVPTMLVHSLWDAEDNYGAIAVYKALKPSDRDNKLFLTIGPWMHGGAIYDASALGPIHFSADTGLQWRQEVLRPFLARYLKDEVQAAPVAPVTAFETGTNKWRSLPSWPAACSGCSITPTLVYLAEGQQLRVGPAGMRAKGFEEYVSDPAKPVPYRARPIQPVGYDEEAGQTWQRWLVDDQREASGRTDVLTYVSDVLTAPLQVSGEALVRLNASTSGTDSDWVVKLIDVYPDQVAHQKELGGYQLMVAGDIFRGRYRESLENAKPLAANKPLRYTFALPTANHVFLKGHRMMVQVQSSWFPLYDRNPQTFVPNIFWAKPADYRKATQRIYHDSVIELPTVQVVH